LRDNKEVRELNNKMILGIFFFVVVLGTAICVVLSMDEQWGNMRKKAEKERYAKIKRELSHDIMEDNV
jgi:hypothetical protein